MYFDFHSFDQDVRVGSLKKRFAEISEDEFGCFGVSIAKIATNITEGVIYPHEHGVGVLLIEV